MRMNVWLVRASQFLRQCSKLEIRHKPGKEHIVPNALSCLASANTNLPSLDQEYSELDALFTYTTTLVDIHPDLIKRIIDGYKADEWWSKLLRQVKDNEAFGVDKAILSFVKEIPIPTDSDPYFLLHQNYHIQYPTKFPLRPIMTRRLWDIQKPALKPRRWQIKKNFSIMLTKWQEYIVCIYLLRLRQKS